MALTVVTPPKGTLLTLDEAKAQLRVDFDEQDDLINALCLTADEVIQGMTQRRYLPQSLKWVLPSWSRRMLLPVTGVGGYGSLNVNGIDYVDLNGAAQTLDPSQYWARPAGQTLHIIPRWYVIWPWLGDGAERVAIRFSIAGAPNGVPAAVKHAAKMLVSHWFNNPDAVVGVDNRDSSTPIPLGVEQLLSGERWA